MKLKHDTCGLKQLLPSHAFRHISAPKEKFSQMHDRRLNNFGIRRLKTGSTLPNNCVFSSAGTIIYDYFQKQQADALKLALTKDLQLVMTRATWLSVRSFHPSIATVIGQGRLSWSAKSVRNVTIDRG